jgi:hypothetical protein
MKDEIQLIDRRFPFSAFIFHPFRLTDDGNNMGSLFKKIPAARRTKSRRAKAYFCQYVGARRSRATKQMGLFQQAGGRS